MRDKVSDPQKAKEINSKIKVLYISTSTFWDNKIKVSKLNSNKYWCNLIIS
jgi:hypothetical protein